MLGPEGWALPPFEPPFEPKSRYFGAQGDALGTGLQAVYGGATLSQGIAGTARTIPQAANGRLQNAIRMLFKPTDRLSGGTAGAIRHTKTTGQLVGGSDHIVAGTERARYLEKILQSENLSPSDRVLAESLLQDLRDALAGK
jgi:hypothetical protein